MASVGFFREKTFDEIIRSKGDVIEPPYRPYTELQRDPKLMAFNFQASLDEVRELELRAQSIAGAWTTLEKLQRKRGFL